MAKEKCTLYIDEAGDLGINRGTKWFVITGVIVKSDEEPEIRKTIQRIRSKLNLHEIHFRKIRNFTGQIFTCKELAQHNFIFISVLLDTSTTNKFIDSIKSYNYMCRMLIERASWYMRDNNLFGDIVLSSRGTKRDGELINYINNKLLNYDRNEIEKGRIRKVCSKQAPEWDLLQLADVCATATFKAYEPDCNDIIFPCFMSNLSDHLYRYHNKLDSYGIKFADGKPENGWYFNKVPCNKK